jgi:acyl carrier protein
MGLDTVELVFAIEKRFCIEIPDREAAKMVTVGMLHTWVVGELRRLERPRIDPDTLFLELQSLICEQLGVNPDVVVAETRFVDNLGAD